MFSLIWKSNSIDFSIALVFQRTLVSLDLLLTPLFICIVVIACFKLKMQVSDLSILEYILQALEISSEFRLIINHVK